jgi:hypothetical protein
MILPDGRTETIHIQTGQQVYIFETDQILPNDNELLAKVQGLKEVQGTAQGAGIETVWWDTSEQPLDHNTDAWELKRRADFVHSLGYTISSKEAKTKIRLIKV